MRQSQKEINKLANADKLSEGTWFPLSKNSYVHFFEVVGRSIAFSIRGFPLLRTRLGAKSFKLWMLGYGFIWFRVWVVMMANIEAPSAWIKLYFLDSFYTTFLSFASYTFLLLGLYYKFNDNFQFSVKGNDVNLADRGDSLLLNLKLGEVIDEYLSRNLVRLAIFEPTIIFVIGFFLTLNSESTFLGYFFMIGATFYAIDEYIHNMAKDEKFGGQRIQIDKGEKTIEAHKKMDKTVKKEKKVYF